MNEREHHGGGLANTFVFGILLGVLFTLLFTTKKGRKLLRAITDEGVERLSHWEDMLKSMEKEIRNDTLEEEPIIGEEVEKEVRAIEAPKKEKIDLEEIEEEKPSPQKRSKHLFKGIRKKA